VVATRTWADDLKAALGEQLEEEAANRLYQLYANAFPAGYREEFPAPNAVLDIQRIEALDPASAPGMSLYAPLEEPEGTLRFKLFWPVRAPLLSEVLPLLEDMGLKVVDERPYEVRPLEGPPCWISDFTLLVEDRGGSAAPARAKAASAPAADGRHDGSGVDKVKEAFQEAFAAIWHGDAESDGFNRLVLRAGLTWREVAVIRAYAKYLRQAGTTFSQSYMERTVTANPAIARLLIDLFIARFRPKGGRGPGKDAAGLARVVEGALDGITNLDEDRILRNFYRMILATVRTNWFQTGADGRPKSWISFKLDPSMVELLPEPRPVAEIFVYSPRVEAVHLRGARVARGGIRWSDRQEDFRTEVLGLMKAQMVKNAVIVPGGAKGGFTVKRNLAGLDRDEVMAEVTDCYRIFMRGLLDLTDNYVRGIKAGADARRPPPDVVRYDDPDPYLVVAADKGTASFSDVANSIAAEYGFWLGDAFASGGSAGYDHKKMGITARGAWESVKRHFRELGVDTQREPFTVAGIGDMSGDVFGNAMLLSEHMRLVAAFNHQHIFLDPDPDPAVSLAERRRLFELPRSGWSDYDPAKISAGGGVWERTVKSIALSPEARRALGVDAEALTPVELVGAILRSPVDLLFNGGIGTYVKAEQETNAEVGDRANDAVRVNGAELRARVVGEGGNLGLTQLGRIEYALAGGRINTDSIDNSAGVDTSDHEVNIKILLDEVVASGDMTAKQRNALLEEMTDEVAALVLRDNYRQVEALSVSEVAAPKMLERHARVIRALEREGRLKRKLEFLPDDKALAERRNRGLGLTRPELAVLLAYVKNDLKADLLGSDVLEDPYFSEELVRYFPAPLRDRFSQQMQRHRLRREIIATHITNSMVNRVGTSFITVVTEETGAKPADIARAYTVAREVFELRELWADVERLDGQVPAHVQTAMLIDGRRLAERGAVWLLRNRRQPIDVASEVKRFGPGVAEVARSLPRLLIGGAADRYEQRVRRLGEQSVPSELARRVAWLSPILSALDVVEVATTADRGVEDVAAVYFELASRLNLDWLRRQILDLPTASHWDERARDALRDELYNQHRQLAAQVLADAGDGVEPAAMVAAWAEANPLSVGRYSATLAELEDASTVDLAMASVALRELRSLARTTQA
jgi:glutamate dehydrogenase